MNRKIGLMMIDGFDKDLLHRSEIFDKMLGALGGSVPKKRLLQIDYKENGIDKHISAAHYQHETMVDDKSLIQVHMAHLNGRVCGAKRPKCEAERSHHL